MRASAPTYASAPLGRSVQLRIDLLAVVLVTLIVSAIYGARLTGQSLFGEETRWATGAREMLATGDWIAAAAGPSLSRAAADDHVDDGYCRLDARRS